MNFREISGKFVDMVGFINLLYLHLLDTLLDNQKRII